MVCKRSHNCLLPLAVGHLARFETERSILLGASHLSSKNRCHVHSEQNCIGVDGFRISQSYLSNPSFERDTGSSEDNEAIKSTMFLFLSHKSRVPKFSNVSAAQVLIAGERLIRVLLDVPFSFLNCQYNLLTFPLMQTQDECPSDLEATLFMRALKYRTSLYGVLDIL